MKRQKLVKSAVMFAASSGLLLTQGCSEEDFPSWMAAPWTPVIVTGTSVNNNGSGNTGGQGANDPGQQSQSLSGLARTGNAANSVGSVGGAF